MMNEEEDNLENILQKQTPPSGIDSLEYKINRTMSKKISQLDIIDDAPKLCSLSENYVHMLENDAHRIREKQRKRYDEWFNSLEKECYPANDILRMYNMFFGHELPISIQGFGMLKGTKKHFTHKRVTIDKKLTTIYTKKQE